MTVYEGVHTLKQLEMQPEEDRKEKSRGRALAEIVICYGLILAVLWTPRPWQRGLFWLALLWAAATTVIDFAGWRAVGLRRKGMRESAWVAGVAAVLAAAGVLVAVHLHTLHDPHSVDGWVERFGGYVIWAFVQQFLMQGYFLLRMLRLIPSPRIAAAATALIFAAAHIPNPILAPLTLVWGLAACLIFLRWRNLVPLAVAHAIFGVTIAVTIPATTLHNMRVGLGYVRYHAPAHRNRSDHTVSTVAWVRAEAPTRRLARQARP